MRVERYRAEHLDRLDLQEGQKYLAVYLPAALRKALEGEFSFTLLDGDEVLCCAGLMQEWDNRAILWSYLAENIGPRRFRVLHSHAKRLLEVAPFKRIEATVDVGFENGHRWMEALGFRMEAHTMRAYRPDGGDSSLYALVR